jgi:cytochrome c oxidase cbb3-type subunit 3
VKAAAAQASAALAHRFAGVGALPLAAIAADARARTTGQRIFVHNCAMCHGSDARGGKGFPDLTDHAWQWGGSQEQVLASILDGRHAAMPPLEQVVGSDTQIAATAAYVRSLSDPSVSQAVARPGKATFDGLCAACHGANGHGNPAIGAPDLTDDAWLYGDTYADIEAAVRHGHDGQMPAHRALLGPTRARLAAAYVWSLSHPQEPGGER